MWVTISLYYFLEYIYMDKLEDFYSVYSKDINKMNKNNNDASF